MADNSGQPTKPHKTQQEIAAEFAMAQLQQRLLDSVKGNLGRETGIWLKNLSEEAKKPFERNEEDDKLRAELHSCMVKWVDQLFDFFQNYAAEYNRMGVGPEFAVRVERPQISTKAQKSTDGTRSSEDYFTGRLTTGQWALIIRGHYQSINCFIIRADKVISFSHDESGFDVYMQMVPGTESNTYKVNGESVSFQNLPPVAKVLFAGLVGASTNENNAGSSITANVKGNILLGSTKEESPTVKPQQSLEARARDLVALGEFIEAFLQRPPSSDEPLPIPSLQKESQPSKPPELERIETSSRPKFLAEAPEGIDWARGNVFDGYADDAKQFARRTQTILRILVDCGAKSFASGRLKNVEPLLKLANRFTELSEQIEEALEEWDQTLDFELKEELQDIASKKQTD